MKVSFEADLVVAFAGGAVRNGVGAFFLGNADLFLGDQRPGDTGAEQVAVLINGAAFEHGPEEIFHEFLA